MTENHLAYPTDLIERIGIYLVSRPYAEVHQLIAGLQTQGTPVNISHENQPKDQSNG